MRLKSQIRQAIKKKKGEQSSKIAAHDQNMKERLVAMDTQFEEKLKLKRKLYGSGKKIDSSSRNPSNSSGRLASLRRDSFQTVTPRSIKSKLPASKVHEVFKLP